MTLENCVKCPNHGGYSMGYVTCAYWNQNQQHIVTTASNGQKIVVGCSLDNSDLRKSW